MNGKTISAVQSDSAAMNQRRQAFVSDQCALNAITLYAQMCIGFALYLYDHVSTPGWISLLLTLPYLLAILLMGSFLLRRSCPQQDFILSAAGKSASKIFYFLFSFLYFGDALLVVYALCAMIQDVMPDHSAWISAIFIAVICSFSISGNREYALPRLGRLLKWLVGGLLLYCFLIAMQHGKTAHFFPFLGYGTKSIVNGAFWMCGPLSSAVWPFLSVKEEDKNRLAQKNGLVFRPVLFAFLLALLTYWVSVWLLPVYAMARPETFGWRLLLVTHMTPSVPAWSMEVIGLILLFLLSLCHSVSNASQLFSQSMGKQKEPRYLAAFLLMFMVPAGALDTPEIRQFLLCAAPLRGVLSLCLLFLLCLLSLFLKKNPSLKETSP